MLDNNLKGSNKIVVETFGGNSYTFSFINENNNMFIKCNADPRFIKRIIIKPDLWIYFNDGGYEHGVKFFQSCYNDSRPLVKKVDIDTNIFNKLVAYKLISYSKGMADLYDFPIAYASDIKYHHNDYKRVGEIQKTRVLNKLKSGNFN